MAGRLKVAHFGYSYLTKFRKKRQVLFAFDTHSAVSMSFLTPWNKGYEMNRR